MNLKLAAAACFPFAVACRGAQPLARNATIRLSVDQPHVITTIHDFTTVRTVSVDIELDRQSNETNWLVFNRLADSPPVEQLDSLTGASIRITRAPLKDHDDKTIVLNVTAGEAGYQIVTVPPGTAVLRDVHIDSAAGYPNGIVASSIKVDGEDLSRRVDLHQDTNQTASVHNSSVDDPDSRLIERIEVTKIGLAYYIAYPETTVRSPIK